MSTERACPVCQGRHYTRFADERIDPARVGALTYASRKPPEFMCLRLVRCHGCDLVYAPTPPSEEFLHAAYGEAAFDSGPEAMAAARTYAAALRAHLPALAARHGAVDVGAGSGPLLPFFQEQGFHPAIGIEPSRAAIEAAPPAVRPLLREGMFCRALLEGESVSLITSFMTLEHLPDPGQFVGTAHGLLEPGGAIALVVHDWRAPLNRLLGRRSPIIDVEHLQLFSPRALRTLLERSGFERIALQPIRNAYPLRYWLRLTPLPAGAKGVLLRLLERLGLADRQLAMNVGNLLAVGFKPR
ncbi:Methyltransferase domain-containing protein [Duganella sp. CF458]|uniref:class I SAM-dependent methyltransferase n=1 Tax=Duganella sp. CF458 TaxID=1884368 RepID=UPI0008EC242F|nr:class I SAM-dependent methyltransferase [Duganella sp. CF458]SFF56032.1 Methyltransferase domain-containing protein [Duganella sp. CF458]